MDSSRKNHVTVTIIGIFVAFYSSLLVAQDSAGPPAPSVNDRTTDKQAATVGDTASGSAEAAAAPSGEMIVSPVPTLVAEPSKHVFEPYLGVITGDNVNIRSGPAEIYYAVGKLHKSQQVVVCGERHGKKNWAMIEPTEQCFSYISKKYVEIQDISDVPDSAVLQETGVVTGNFVRVRAGSIKVPPVNARQVQTKLNFGTVVQIVGERDDFYKIASPPGCYFWISLDYIRSIGPVTAEIAVSVRSQVASSISDKPEEKITLTEAQLERAEYQELARLFKTEQDKPVLQRELASLQQRLEKLIEDAQTPSVKSLAHRLMRTLARAELARNALKISLSQDERLRITLEEIDKKVELLVSTRAPAGMKQQENVIQGILAPSAVFTATNQNRRFLVLGDNDRIICYAVCDIDGPDLSQWLGKKVSLVGRTRFDAFGKTRILYVTGIIELPSVKK